MGIVWGVKGSHVLQGPSAAEIPHCGLSIRLMHTLPSQPVPRWSFRRDGGFPVEVELNTSTKPGNPTFASNLYSTSRDRN